MVLNVRSAKENLAFKGGKWVLLSLGLCVPLCGFPAPVRCQQAPAIWEPGISSPLLRRTAGSSLKQAPEHQLPGNIRGRVVDQSGSNITGALVKLTREGQSLSPEVESDEDGQFFFFNIDPGPFELTITSEGLAGQTVS